MYTEITSQESLNNFLELVDFFHDAILRETSIVSRGYVDKELRMFDDAEPSDARLVFQMQSIETPCIEVIFESVTILNISPGIELEPSGEFSAGNVVFYLEGSETEHRSMVVASGMKYRILGSECLGQRLLTVDEIPTGKIVEASLIEGDWARCPVCVDAWKVTRNKEIIRCPSCGTFNRIPGSIGKT